MARLSRYRRYNYAKWVGYSKNSWLTILLGGSFAYLMKSLSKKR